MADGKNIRVTSETFAKLDSIKKKARGKGKRLSLGVIIDDLCDFEKQLLYINNDEIKES